ncbi:MAG TPA: hypothetical protein VIE37_02865 [Methylomirabilota bacterium]|jgi:hypothetical protein
MTNARVRAMIDSRVALLVGLLLGSCTSLTPVRSDEVHTSLKAGDTVQIVTRDGKTTTFEIVAVTMEAIVGQDHRIAFVDIAELQKREVDAGKTVGMVAAILGVIALIALPIIGFAALAGAL